MGGLILTGRDQDWRRATVETAENTCSYQAAFCLTIPCPCPSQVGLTYQSTCQHPIVIHHSSTPSFIHSHARAHIKSDWLITNNPIHCQSTNHQASTDQSTTYPSASTDKEGCSPPQKDKTMSRFSAHTGMGMTKLPGPEFRCGLDIHSSFDTDGSDDTRVTITAHIFPPVQQDFDNNYINTCSLLHSFCLYLCLFAFLYHYTHCTTTALRVLRPRRFQVLRGKFL